jgi:hypothetical protein
MTLLSLVSAKHDSLLFEIIVYSSFNTDSNRSFREHDCYASGIIG